MNSINIELYQIICIGTNHTMKQHIREMTIFIEGDRVPFLTATI